MTRMPPLFTKISNDPKGYEWGAVDGVSRVLGHPPTGERQAELWFGAHPSGPSRAVTDAAGGPDGAGLSDAQAHAWADLAEWEQASGRSLPFLLKILCAASPLSIQAHPTPEQAVQGFDCEEASGVPIDARHRNYKDRSAKPELIVALADGFEALCGFRPIAETRGLLDRLAGAGVDARVLAPWRERLVEGQDARAAFTWVLSGAPEVSALVSAVGNAATRDAAAFELARRLGDAYPGDPGILVALMMNHVTLAAGEAIWLPAGNVHAYLRGDGVELMGPSDNVLRGGLTPKHVDTVELERVLDFSTGDASRLPVVHADANVRSYRPSAVASGRDVGFELLALEADGRLTLHGASIAVVTDGGFAIEGDGQRIEAPRGSATFIAGAETVEVTGRGRLFCATGTVSETHSTEYGPNFERCDGTRMTSIRLAEASGI